MKSKIYTISYTRDGVPSLRITGNWLKNHGLEIGTKVALDIDNNTFTLSRLSQDKKNEIDIAKHIKKLSKELNEFRTAQLELNI